MTAPATSGPGKNDDKTKSPIKHVIVIIGENRSFDHVFGTYKAKNGQRVDNILSKGIVKEDGSPGPNFSLAIQKSAVDSPPNTFQLSPPDQTPYAVLPPVTAGGPTTAFVSSLAQATTDESLALPTDYLVKLTTGATGLKSGTPDTRLAQKPADRSPRAVPALTGHHGRRLRRKPGSPLLPDVAAARLQPRSLDRVEPVRLHL